MLSSSFRRLRPTNVYTSPLARALRFKTIVVVMDIGQPAAFALRWSLQNIISPSDSLRLLTVKAQGPASNVEAMVSIRESEPPVNPELGWSLDSEEHARAIQEWVSSYNIENVSEEVLHKTESGVFGIGGPICEYIERIVDMEGEESVVLVLGTRELGFMKRAFLGSVSEHCVRNCPSPVVVVKLPTLLALQLRSRSIDDPDVQW